MSGRLCSCAMWAIAIGAVGGALGVTPALAQPISIYEPPVVYDPLYAPPRYPRAAPRYVPVLPDMDDDDDFQSPGLVPYPSTRGAPNSAAVAPRMTPQELDADVQSNGEVPAQFRRQTVPYPTREPAGTIVIDTPHTFLYYVLGGGQAIRYGIGVGREGFTWSGTRTIGRKMEWPDWEPPPEMIDRQPYLPRWMAGGPGNPLGARAMYLAGTLYRIHGTSEPNSIGKRVSSGCIRMLNEDAIDLYNRVKIGTKVVVMPDDRRHVAEDAPAAVRPASTVTPQPRGFSAGGLY